MKNSWKYHKVTENIPYREWMKTIRATVKNTVIQKISKGQTSVLDFVF